MLQLVCTCKELRLCSLMRVSNSQHAWGLGFCKSCVPNNAHHLCSVFHPFIPPHVVNSSKTMSGRFYALCLAGLVGSLFVGYCIYFDRKRRSDPDYKKKVLTSESIHCSWGHIHKTTVMLITGRRLTQRKNAGPVIDLRDPKVREEFLMSEMVKANQNMMEGQGSLVCMCVFVCLYCLNTSLLISCRQHRGCSGSPDQFRAVFRQSSSHSAHTPAIPPSPHVQPAHQSLRRATETCKSWWKYMMLVNLAS